MNYHNNNNVVITRVLYYQENKRAIVVYCYIIPVKVYSIYVYYDCLLFQIITQVFIIFTSSTSK